MAGMNMSGMTTPAAKTGVTGVDDVKEVKLEGTLVCGSCALKESKKCTNVLQVKEKDKTINYWLTDKGNDEVYHEKICGGGKLEGVTVTGVVTEKDGKKLVKASKVELKK